jgi:hypothetical protein
MRVWLLGLTGGMNWFGFDMIRIVRFVFFTLSFFFSSFMFSGFDLFWLHFCVFVWIRVLNFAIVNFFGWGFVNF